jgi:hypothetical protein
MANINAVTLRGGPLLSGEGVIIAELDFTLIDNRKMLLTYERIIPRTNLGARYENLLISRSPKGIGSASEVIRADAFLRPFSPSDAGGRRSRTKDFPW